jgi:hypothetical protein
MKTLFPCIYRNLANHPQVLRISEISLYFERTVYPNQCIAYEALPESVIEIQEDVIAMPSDSFTIDEEVRALDAESLFQFQTLEVA